MPISDKVKSRLVFMQEFLKHPLQIGSIIPSSPFLEQRIVTTADIASANVVVELGSGTGGITRALLNAIPQHAKLLSLEINPHFHTVLKNIEDERLIAHLESACKLKELIALYNLEPPDVIVSGIPFSTMSHSDGTQILKTISSQLAPNGRFVAYQVSKQVMTLSQPFLGSAQTTTEFRNIPPMRIFQWEKHDDGSSNNDFKLNGSCIH